MILGEVATGQADEVLKAEGAGGIQLYGKMEGGHGCELVTFLGGGAQGGVAVEDGH